MPSTYANPGVSKLRRGRPEPCAMPNRANPDHLPHGYRSSCSAGRWVRLAIRPRPANARAHAAPVATGQPYALPPTRQGVETKPPHLAVFGVSLGNTASWPDQQTPDLPDQPDRLPGIEGGAAWNYIPGTARGAVPGGGANIDGPSPVPSKSERRCLTGLGSQDVVAPSDRILVGVLYLRGPVLALSSVALLSESWRRHATSWVARESSRCVRRDEARTDSRPPFSIPAWTRRGTDPVPTSPTTPGTSPSRRAFPFRVCFARSLGEATLSQQRDCRRINTRRAPVVPLRFFSRDTHMARTAQQQLRVAEQNISDLSVAFYKEVVLPLDSAFDSFLEAMAREVVDSGKRLSARRRKALITKYMKLVGISRITGDVLLLASMTILAYVIAAGLLLTSIGLWLGWAWGCAVAGLGLLFLMGRFKRRGLQIATDKIVAAAKKKAGEDA